jgi:hypothetical protein
MTMGWSPFVSGRHGFPRGRAANDLDDWAHQRSAQARADAVNKAEEQAKAKAQAKPSRDTLELSSRQGQLGKVQFASAPVPIFVSGIDYRV